MSPSTAYEDRLTEEAYWDSQYEPAASSVAPTPPARTKGLLGRLRGPRLRDLVQDYREHLVWNVLYPRYLPRRAGAKLLEVGSAPGTHLVQVHKSYGFDCYGVEYTPRGAELNRKVFRLNGLDPANVIHADFFSPEFQTRYRGYFDIVLSRGFIEHFRDVDRVLSAHLNVIAPGGMLAVTIPNLRGINYGLAWFFCKELLPLHNLDIMNGARCVRQGPVGRERSLSRLSQARWGGAPLVQLTLGLHRREAALMPRPQPWSLAATRAARCSVPASTRRSAPSHSIALRCAFLPLRAAAVTFRPGAPGTPPVQNCRGRRG